MAGRASQAPPRPEGRPGPPKRYPKNQDHYADPENWKYPIHTPVHARRAPHADVDDDLRGRARQYFDKPANRAKYTGDEQAYMDARINAALEHFGESGD